jgi:signal peptidase II
MPDMQTRAVAGWLALAAGVALLDQVSKYAISHTLAHGRDITVTPFFKLVLVYNPGAAFSFLSSASGWQREFFIGIAVVASVWITYLLVRHTGERLFCFALAMILGGAIGNVIDRVRLGAVVDFLYFHAGGWSFPAFNLADSAITLGAALLIWDGWFRRPAPKTI